MRGSLFSKINLTRQDRILARLNYIVKCMIYVENAVLMRSFIGQCIRDHLDEWVDKFGGELRLHSRICKNCKKDIEYLPNHHRFCEGCFSMY